MSLTVAEAISRRRANRNYLDKPIPDEVLDRVVAQALEAPSAFNLQLRDLVVIREPKIKEAIYNASGQQQFRDAPVVLVAVARAEALPEDAAQIVNERRLKAITRMKDGATPQALREAALKDAALLAGFALIAATAEGLASCPTTGWDDEKVKEAIGLGGRADRGIALVMSLGYSDDQPQHPGRIAQRRVDDHY